MVKSTPTGDMTPARSETAAKVLFAIPATKWTAEGIYVLLRLSRDYWWWWPCLRWPESTAASSAAAAGVRSCMGTGLELEGERSEALGMLYWVL